jgi:AcrR family transcriptional regulator
MTEHNQKSLTRQRLLESACRVFAEKGFHKATILDICGEAGANVAAVNYHFGGKRKLYDKAWRHAFALAEEAFPLDGGLTAEASGEERLRAFIFSFLHRLFDDGPSGYFSRMMNREMAEPTSSFPAIYQEVLVPTRGYLCGVLRGLLGTDVAEEQVLRCSYSVISQCVFFSHHLPRPDRRSFEKGEILQNINMLGDYVTCFCLGGIRAVGG